MADKIDDQSAGYLYYIYLNIFNIQMSLSVTSEGVASRIVPVITYFNVLQ